MKKTAVIWCIFFLMCSLSRAAVSADGWVSHVPETIASSVSVSLNSAGGATGQLRLWNDTASVQTNWVLRFESAGTVSNLWGGTYQGVSGTVHTVSAPAWQNHALHSSAFCSVGLSGSSGLLSISNLTFNGFSVASETAQSPLCFRGWAQINGLSFASINSDPDGDGLSNAQEFLFGTAPALSNAVAVSVAVSNLTVHNVPNRYLTAEVECSTRARGVEYRVELSDDQTVWLGGTNVMVLHEVSALPGDRCRALWRSAQPLYDAAASRFVRVVTRPQGDASVVTQIGVNVNKQPENLDMALVEQTAGDWIRASINFFDFYSGREDFSTHPGWLAVKAAGQDGYRILLTLRWDFKSESLRLPLPGSQDEIDHFNFLDGMLDEIAPWVEIVVCGNEPVWETADEDKVYVESFGDIPLTVFYKQVAAHLNQYRSAMSVENPFDLYMGSFVQMYKNLRQTEQFTLDLIDYAQQTAWIDGVDLHIHVQDDSDTQFHEALSFLRGRLPSKPLTASEFSVMNAWWDHYEETIGVDAAGQAFAQAYGRDPSLTVMDFLTIAKTQTVSFAEWNAFIDSRSWLSEGFISRAAQACSQYGVRMISRAQAQVSNVQPVEPDDRPWFADTMFLARTVPMPPDVTGLPNYDIIDEAVRINQLCKGGEPQAAAQCLSGIETNLYAAFENGASVVAVSASNLNAVTASGFWRPDLPIDSSLDNGLLCLDQGRYEMTVDVEPPAVSGAGLRFGMDFRARRSGAAKWNAIRLKNLSGENLLSLRFSATVNPAFGTLEIWDPDLSAWTGISTNLLATGFSNPGAVMDRLEIELDTDGFSLFVNDELLAVNGYANTGTTVDAILFSGESDTAGAWYDNLLLTKTPAPARIDFARWLDGFTVSSGDTAPTADPDGDGKDNLTEYAFGGDPQNGSDHGFRPALQAGSAPGQLHYIYPRRTGSSSPTYRLQFCTSLVSGAWADYEAETGTGTLNADLEAVTNDLPVAEEPSGYLRLKISL